MSNKGHLRQDRESHFTPPSTDDRLPIPLEGSSQGGEQKKKFTSSMKNSSFLDNQPMILRMDTHPKTNIEYEEIAEAFSFDSEKEDRFKDLTGILKDM